MRTGPISLLYFTNTLARAGVEEHILTLFKNLDRNRFRLFMACAPEMIEQLRPDLPADVEVFPVPLLSWRDFPAARRLAHVLVDRRIDILHSHTFQSSRLASPIGWARRVPVIVETPHLREHWRKGWLQGSFLVDRLVGRFVGYYIAVSEANARYLVQEKGLPRRKILTIHNGADLSRFDPARLPPAGMKKGLGFDEQDPVVLAFARLDPQKGHEVLLKALPAVRREFPRVRLVCAGSGTLRAELEALSRSLGLEDNVRFVGYQSNAVDWLALAEITALPSHFEGLPIVAIESLAMGKPMVATDVDGTGEVVVDGMTGLTVPPGNSERLAEAIVRLLRDPGLRRRLGKAGRDRVVRHFSQEQQVRKTAEFYLRAMEGPVEVDEPGASLRAVETREHECPCAGPAGSSSPAGRLAGRSG